MLLSEIENRDSNTAGVGEFIEQIYTYDILNNIVHTKNEVDASKSIEMDYRYDENQNLNFVRLPEGNEMVTTYDERDLLFTVTQGAGTVGESTEIIDYDKNGNKIRITDAEDNDGDGNPEAMLYIFDGFDRMKEMVDALGNQAMNSFDVASNVTRLQVFGHPAGQPSAANVLHSDVVYFFDELNRSYQVDEALFVADGFVPKRTPNLFDDKDNRTTYEYDALDRPIRQTNAKTDEITTLVYDRDSNLTELIDPNGTSSVRAFDALNRPVGVTVDRAAGVGGTTEEIFEYDGMSRLTRTSDNNGEPASTQVLEYVYDSLSRVLEENQNGQSVSSVYSGDGKRIESILPGGRRLTKTFDLIDRVKEINDSTSGNSLLAAMDWIGPGMRELRRLHGNNTVMTYLNDSADGVVGYDAVKRVIQSRLLNQGGVALLDRQYDYNRADINKSEQRNDDDGLTDNLIVS
jgi:hypothetical protein